MRPVAQIRPHAIRSPSASSYTRQPMTDDDDSKCSVEVRASVDQHSAVPTRDDASETLTAAGGVAAEASTGWRFGTLRSRIKDYVTAAAGVGAGRRQTTSSTSFADWTMPRGRRQGVARRSSSATSWEPDRSDYAAAGDDASRGSLDDSAATWFPGPRPFSSPRSRATEVSLPQHIIASANSSLSSADVTSTITSRISTFLTFLGGSSRRPETSDTPPPSASSTSLASASTALDSGATERCSDAKAPAARAVVDPIVSGGTLDRRSCRSASTPPVRSASTSEALARAAAAAAAAARDTRGGRQPLRLV